MNKPNPSAPGAAGAASPAAAREHTDHKADDHAAATAANPAADKKALEKADKADAGTGVVHPAEQPAGDDVNFRVLPKGDGVVATGNHSPAEGDLHFRRGDTGHAPEATVKELEDRGFVERI